MRITLLRILWVPLLLPLWMLATVRAQTPSGLAAQDRQNPPDTDYAEPVPQTTV